VLLTAFAASVLAGCTATTSFRATDPELALAINKDAPIALDSPARRTYDTTSFGQFHFQATKPGQEPMYGLVPLKFNGGYLATDILLFAPGMFFNLREVYPIYEFDVAQGVVRYKKNESDAWMSYKPTTAEAERAKKFFVK
jgi:hypothetical protein